MSPLSSVRPVLVPAAVALVAAAALAQTGTNGKGVRKEEWKDYKAPADFKFACRFPGKPEVAEESVDTASGELSLLNGQLESAGVTFMVTCLRRPDNAKFDVKAELDGARASTVARIKGSVRSDKDIKVAGGVAAHETVYATFIGGKKLWTARIIRIGPRIYVLQAGRPDGDHPAAVEAVTTFLDSFKPEM